MITIGEVSRRLGISPDTLKRWESDGKIPKPRRTCGGWRTYSDDDLREIRRAMRTEQK